jgi:hypothetical protein
MRRTALTAAVILGCAATPANADDTELFILGALHGLHEQEESFGYAELERVIEAIKPDVMLLEVTPDELAGRLETKGRPEYPKVIWPMLARNQVEAYAMELGQPQYGELTGDAGRRWGEFKKSFPADDSALTAHATATSNVLLAHWKSVADTQDNATDALGRARTELSDAMVAESAPIQMRWDMAMVESVKAAIAENAGKRILVLGSYRNRYMFVEQLRGTKNAQLIDMQNWLETNGFGRSGSASR